jgi:hypothetical protein
MVGFQLSIALAFGRSDTGVIHLLLDPGVNNMSLAPSAFCCYIIHHLDINEGNYQHVRSEDAQA